MITILILTSFQPQDPMLKPEFTSTEAGQLVAKINAEIAYRLGGQKYRLKKTNATLYMQAKKTDPVRKVILVSDAGEYSEKEKILKLTGNCKIDIENGPSFSSKEAKMDIQQFDLELTGDVTASNLRPNSKLQFSSQYSKIFLRKTKDDKSPFVLEKLQAHTKVFVKDPEGYTIEADDMFYGNEAATLTSAKFVTITQFQNTITCKTVVVKNNLMECDEQVTSKFDQSTIQADHMTLFLEQQNSKAALKKAVISNAIIKNQNSIVKAPRVIREGDEMWLKGPKSITISNQDSKLYLTSEGDIKITPTTIDLYKKCIFVGTDYKIYAGQMRIWLQDGNMQKFVAMQNPLTISNDRTVISSSLVVYDHDTVINIGRPFVRITGPGFTMRANITSLDVKSGKFSAQKITDRTRITAGLGKK